MKQGLLTLKILLKLQVFLLRKSCITQSSSQSVLRFFTATPDAATQCLPKAGQGKGYLLTAELSFNLNQIAYVENFNRQQNSQGVLVGGRTEASSHSKMENQLLLYVITSFQQRGKYQLVSATWNSLDQSFHTAGKLVQILGMYPAF